MGIFKAVGLCLFAMSACNSNTDLGEVIQKNSIIQEQDTVNFRNEMRNFVIKISNYAKNTNTGFAIIPQNGIELITLNGEPNGEPSINYLNAIDANGQESLFYGYNEDNKATPQKEKDYTIEFLKMSKNKGNTILVTDYCSSSDNVADSYENNNLLGFVSFAANERDLTLISDSNFPIFNENSEDVNTIHQAKNFLYLINLEKYNSKTQFINAVKTTNYDVVLIDLFFNDGQSFNHDDIAQLKNKANGGKRLVISYMSIGEAEDYRYYWQTSWKSNKPSWLAEENPNWGGNFKVKYWNSEWQKIILGNENAYLDKILNAGFDGVYLDIIDGFEYFEAN